MNRTIEVQKMKKVKIIGKNYYPKNIRSTPDNIVTTGVEKNKCTNNAKLLIDNNIEIDIKYVEGFMLIYQNGIYRAVAHAWNIVDNLHFDTSAEVFEKTTNLDIEHSKQYFPIFISDVNSLPKLQDGILPFSERFIPYIKVMGKLYPTN